MTLDNNNFIIYPEKRIITADDVGVDLTNIVEEAHKKRQKHLKDRKITEYNKIYNENCLDTMSSIKTSSIDLVITSPPYDDLRDYDNISSWNEYVWKKVLKEIYRILKHGSTLVWIVGDSTDKGTETLSSLKQAVYMKEECGFLLNDTMIFQKNSTYAVQTTRYYPIFEYMFIATKGKINKKKLHLIEDRPNKSAGKVYKHCSRKKDGSHYKENKGRIIPNFGVRYNIWKYSVGGGNSYDSKETYLSGHPAIMPIKLAIDHIKSWSNPGDVVYDPFMGAGTVAKAALIQDRQFLGSEVNSEYCKIISKRLKNYQRKNQLKNYQRKNQLKENKGETNDKK